MKLFLLFTTMLISLSVIGQAVDIKSAEATLEGNSSDSVKFLALITLHNAYFTSDPKKCRFYTEKMLELAKKLHDDRYLSKAYMAFVRLEGRNHNYEKSSWYNHQILKIAERSKKEPAILAANLTLAREYLDNDQHTKAMPYLKVSDEMSTRLKDTSQIAKVKQTYAWYYDKLNQPKKAILYYDTAIMMYEILGDEVMLASSRILVVESLIKLGKTDRVPGLIFSALENYTKRKIVSRQAYCYGLLGQCYFLNGFEQKGIENYLQAKRLFKSANSPVDDAMVSIDIATHFLGKKDFKESVRYAKEADKVLNEHQYEYGMIEMHTFWGQYYSLQGNYQLAENHFETADKLSIANDLPELQVENEKYRVEHLKRQKNYKGADSLMYSYARKLVELNDPDAISAELQTIMKKNREIDTTALKLLAVLYSKGGAAAIKKQMGARSLTESGYLNSIFSLNSLSHATPAYDSLMTISYNRQLLQMETQFRTRQTSDSLHIEKQNAAIVKQSLRNRNIILSASALALVLLASVLYVQYQSRKRAEKDKAKIELLQNEIHHRVKNNLGVISRLVDVAGKNAVDVVPLSSLKNRIRSIETLHNHLYNGNSSTGNVSLQAYFEDLCLAVAATYETATSIEFDIKAATEIDSQIAEKLGLIINELVTNCYKYAFDGMEQGLINISTSTIDDKNLKIVVEDNGIGFEPGKTKSSYGMKLIKGLSNELNGRFAFINGTGTRFTLEIPF